MKYLLASFILWFCANPLLAGTGLDDIGTEWVDSVFNRMTTNEKIGQLFMIRAHSNLGQKHIKEVKRQIREYHVGGLCFFQGTAEKQADLTNIYQELSQVPLLIAIDAEWGLGMRFKEAAQSFPRQLTLGAIQDNALIYEMGLEIGSQLRAIGVHVNFAPVADVNNNPLNPVIHDRSFGENRYNVAAKAFQYMRGLQDAGIMACGKHFPGHGDTDVDSHLDLPVIRHDKQRLDSIELYPFRVLIENGLQSMMVAHLEVPALDTQRHTPTTLSQATITGLLKEELGFDGLIFTDALEMKGVTKHYGPGEVALRAFMAGNDMLVLPENMDQAVALIRSKVEEGTISGKALEQRVKRILRAKWAHNLHQMKAIDDAQLKEKIHGPKAIALKSRLIENALTLVRNERNLVPLSGIEGKRFASLVIGSTKKTAFQKRLDSYISVKHFNTDLANPDTNLLRKLDPMDMVFVGISGMSKYASQNFGLSQETRAFLASLKKKTQVILTIFGSPYSLVNFEGFDHVLLAYEPDALNQDLAAQALLGAISLRGRLPVTASPGYMFNHGLATSGLLRLGFSVPERVGLSSDTLALFEQLAHEMVQQRAAPGCQLLVAKDRRIVYHNVYGSHTYQGVRPVMADDLYDVASITKVAATTMAMMKLHDDAGLDPDDRMSHYLEHLNNTNKAGLRIKNVMSHQAGLKPWIPFYAETMIGSRSPRPSGEIYNSAADEKFSIPVARNLYMLNSYVPQIFQQILDSELRPTRRYRYSDLGFYLLAQLVEEEGGKPLNAYCQTHFYGPLGLRRTMFNPHDVLSEAEVIPSEEDNYFRKQRVQGYVHDMGSAMLGGVSGHAGLFSNAGDLAVLGQLLLNNGYYGGKRYIHEATIQKFTTRVKPSTRRAIGFDMKELNPDRKSFTSQMASDGTFGHTGFTGTCIWIDPQYDLIFIFLSNRTFPSQKNNRLQKLEMREKMHSLAYRAMMQ